MSMLCKFCHHVANSKFLFWNSVPYVFQPWLVEFADMEPMDIEGQLFSVGRKSELQWEKTQMGEIIMK